jgi:hypothetical protein
MSDTTHILPTFTARSFEQLSRFVGEVNECWQERWAEEMPGFCFRGMDDATYDLNPGLLRWPYPEAPEDLCHLENSLWGDFRLRSKPLLGRQVSGDWEAFLIMQQFGFPTRFLDWSRSLAVAAYFSARDLENDQDGSLWVMASRHLMEMRGIMGVWRTIIGNACLEPLRPRVNADGLAEFNAQQPVPVSPDLLVDRMVAQQGIYTLHTFERNALERLAVADRAQHDNACFLHKVIISGPAKSGLRKEISVVAGVTEESLFPDLDGFARAFVAEHKEKARRRTGRPTSR